MFLLSSASFVVTNLHSSAINELYQDTNCDAPGIGNQMSLEKYIRICARARANFVFARARACAFLPFIHFRKELFIDSYI